MIPRFPVLPRRALLQGAAGLAAASLLRCTAMWPGGNTANARLTQTRLAADGIVLTAQERATILGDNRHATPTWLYTEQPFPVFRMRVGDPLRVTLVNNLSEHTTIHWHGMRAPNGMDGVPYVTQMPVLPGERFDYAFTPPDTGFFFFHPHCNTAEQFGRGLVGILIVEGDEVRPFDDDVVCVLHDWRLAEDGGFLPFVTDDAARAGTFGTMRTANNRISPEIDVPAGADIRFRLVNLDATRTGMIGVEGTESWVIAIDGNAVTPFVLDTWRLGTAMRLELALRTPAEGGRVRLIDYFATDPVTLATLVPRATRATRGEPLRRGASGIFTPTPLKSSGFPEPDLANGQFRSLTLGTSPAPSTYRDLPPIVLPDGRIIDLLDTLCANPQTFWAIDGKAWPEEGHRDTPTPLMRFSRGQTAIIEFVNTSRQAHPMHLHGHTFKVLSCSRLARPVHWADTVLVMPDERVRIAFVADNPGNWMIHCHILEHQDTGMMAWFEVV